MNVDMAAILTTRLYLLSLLIYLYIVKSLSEVELKDMSSIKTLTTDFPTRVGKEVKVIQVDTSRPGYLIISTGQEIFSMQATDNGNTTNTTILIAGNAIAGYEEGVGQQAKFNYIGGVVQISENFFVTDVKNHCLRKISIISDDPKTWETSVFAGDCGVIGDIDGLRRNAKFNSPNGVVRRDTYLYVADSANKKIKRVSIEPGDEVTSVHQSENHSILRLTLGPRLDEFYATAGYGVLHIYNRMETWTVGGTYSYSARPKNGQFSGAVLDSPQDIAWLNNETLAVVDKNCVQVFDLSLQVVTLVCNDRLSGYVDGNIKNCRLSNPQSLMITNGTVYIGEKTTHGGVRSLTFTDTTNWNWVQTTKAPELRCPPPPDSPNAFYTTSDNYTRGTEVIYSCVDRHSSYGSNTKLVCSVLENKETIWVGELIQCQLNEESKAMIALAVFFSLTVVALILVSVKLLLVMRFSGQNSQQSATNREQPPPAAKRPDPDYEYMDSQPRPLPSVPGMHTNPQYSDHQIDGGYLDPSN